MHITYTRTRTRVGLLFFAAPLLLPVVASAQQARSDTPHSVSYQQSVSVISHDGKPIETTNSTVRILRGHLRRTEYQHGGINVDDARQGKYVSIDPRSKSFAKHTKHVVTDAETGETTEKAIGPPAPNHDFFASILAVPGKEAEQIGEQTIDGRKARGLRTTSKNKRDTSTRTYWVDAKTNRPLRIKYEYQLKDPKALKQVAIMSRFVFDASLDESLFSIEPPNGFTVKEEPVYAIELK